MLTSQRFAAAIRTAAILLAIVAILPAAAQEMESTQETALSTDELKARLDALRSELEAEQAAQSNRAEQNAAEIDQLSKVRKELADRLLTAQSARVRNASRLKALQEQAESVRAESAQLVSEAASIADAFAGAAEQLRVHLNEIPGSDESVRRLMGGTERLQWSQEAAPSNTLLDALDQLLREFNATHQQATSLTVRKASVFTADGRQETVKLLSLGHVRFAYETVDGSRIGLALAAPNEASGYRWSENLGADIEGRIRDAIQAVESQGAALIAVPIDPTGRVQPDMVNSEPGFFERLRSGGLVMWPLAGLALVALLLIVERMTVFYGRNGHGDRLAAKVMAACNSGQFDRALEVCQKGRGAVSRVLEACLRRRRLGQRAMEDSVQEQLLQELPRLNRFMGGIATLAAVAPLLGLLGTVTGIIRTFGVIRAFGNANPSLMAGGISEALLTTASGLVIAVPILIVHAVLRGRSERIVADAERHAAMLLMSLVHTDPGTDQGRGQKSGDQLAAAGDEISRAKQPGNGEAVAADEASSVEAVVVENEEETTVG